MEMDESIMYLGIVILGGLILIAGAFVIIKSTPRKGATRNDSAYNAGPDPGRQKRSSAKNEEKHTDKPSLFNRLRGKMSRGLAVEVKDGPSPNEQPEPATNEHGPSRMPDLNSLGLQTNDLHSLAERDTLSAEPVNQVEPAPELSPAPLAEPAQPPGTEPPVEEGDSMSVINDLPAVPEQDPPPEEAEIPVPETPAEETPANDQESKTDDLLDMFKDEIVEETEAGKFASTLEDIDVHDLLEQSQSLINYLSGNGGR